MESEANRDQPTAAEGASSDPNSTPSLSKSEAIAALQNTIQQLEEIVTQLDTNTSTDTIPIESSVDTLVTTTKELATAIATLTQTVSPPQPPQTVPEDKQEDITAPPKTSPTVPQEPVTNIPTVATPTPKPKPKKPKKNNRLLIGAIAALIIIGIGIVWWRLPQTPVALLSRSESTDIEIVTPTDDDEAEDIAIVTPTDDAEAENIEIETQAEINDEEIPDTLETPDSLDTAEETLITDAESELESETIVKIDIPLELEAPAAPQKIELEIVEPEIILTPEQNLIAAIQNRVTEITEDYSDDLIVSVEADFRQNSLSIILSNLWYELSESRQNKLANDILKRSRKLDFQKLAIKNTEGILIARNPVIGNTAIILQRAVAQEEGVGSRE